MGRQTNDIDSSAQRLDKYLGVALQVIELLFFRWQLYLFAFYKALFLKPVCCLSGQYKDRFEFLL